MNLTTRAKRRIVTQILAALALVGLGALVGVLIAAPSTADIYNACVADKVVPRAGVPAGGISPGPPANPYSDPRARWSAPPTWTPSRAPLATPQVVTPPGRP